MKLSARHLVGLAIALLWIGAMALLWRREAPPSAVAVATAEPAVRDLRLAILLGEETRVGTVALSSRPEARNGAPGERFDLDARLTLRLLGEPTDLEITGSTWRARDAARLELDLAVSSVGQTLEVRAETRGDRLVGTVTSAGATTPIDLPLGAGQLFEGGFGGTFRFPSLAPGESARVATFDPVTLSPSTARVRCVGTGVREIGGVELAVRELEIETGGLVLRAYTDPDGGIVRAETPFGFVLERLPDDPVPAERSAGTGTVAGPEASGGDGVAGEDLLALTAVRPVGLRPHRGARELELAVRGAPVDLPRDATQEALGGGRFRIRPIGPDGPAPGDVEAPLPADLAPTPLVQSDHPRIVALASEITAGLADPAARARALHDWVFTEIAKEPAMSVPSALAVLEARRGDCNEHAVLFAALARAAGLPTRIAIGLVWSETWDGFYYHAWPRVHLGDRWVWADPTLGQPVADATHLQLLEGGIEHWPRLLRWLGRIELEVLAVSPADPALHSPDD